MKETLRESWLRTTLCLLFVLCTFFAGSPARADDAQLWSQFLFSLHSSERFDLGFYYEMRLRDDASQAFGWFSGPKVTWRLHENLWLGGAVKHIEIEGSGFLDGRLELEVVPRAKLSENLRFDFRNRVEVFHVREGPDTTRFRHRLRLSWILKRGALDRIFTSFEAFHEDGDGLGDVTEERIVPFGARLKLTRRGSLDLCYLLRRRDGREDVHALGTFFILRR